MKIAIDFDGVCTDLSFVSEQRANEFDYLYSPFSISISKPRKGILELISVFGLFADLSIITSRPVEDEAYIKDWLSKNELLSFFKDVFCCGDVAKSEMMKQQGITLLIDDKPKHLVSLPENLKGILWSKQTWMELTKEIFDFLISTSNSSLKAKADLILSKVEYLTDLGSSQVFILSFADKTKLKLRVCLNESVKQRVINFLEIATRNNYNHVSRLISANGLAILKSFVEGNLISTFNEGERLIYISKAGSALAKLHSIKIDKSISDLKFHLNEPSESLLVFSADNYNMIVTKENEVAFIDLEACNSGSRWIDFHWSENLLCDNDQEKKALTDGYFSIYKGNKATEEEMKMAKLNYKLWLTYQLQNSKLIHSTDSEKLKIIDDTFLQLWSN
jgi:hypothetical protein